MNWVTALFLLAVLHLAHLKVYSQEFTYSLFDTQDGLPSSTITALVEDDAGHLWIGTDAGLVRYNGYEFQHFYDNPSYRMAQVNALAVDSSGRLWVGTNTGLSLYREGVFYPVDVEGLDTASVQSLSVTQNQKALIATINHLFIIENIGENSQLVEKFESKGILKITEEVNGEIWLGTIDGLKRLSADSIENVIDDRVINQEDVVDILPHEESLLIGTSEENVYHYTFTDRQLEVVRSYDDYYHDFVSFERWDGHIWCVYGWLILSQTDTGATKIHYPPEWNIKLVNTSFVDSESNLWLGSTEGLIRIRKSAFLTIDHSEIESEIYSMMEDRNQTIWLGSNHGMVYQWNKDGVNAWEKPDDFEGEVIDIVSDANNNIWIASFWKGLVLLSNEEITRIHETDISELGPDIYDLHLDQDQNLWIGTYRGLFVRKNGQDHFISCDTLGIPNHCDVYQIKHGPSGIWVGASCGLYHLQNDRFRLMTLPGLTHDIPIRSLLIDNESIWVGTIGYGLRCYSFNNDQLHLQEVIDHPDRMIFDITKDVENIWAGTPRHLLKIMRDTIRNFQVFTSDDGFFDEGYSYLKLFVDHDNDLFVTTSKGLKQLVTKTKLVTPGNALLLDYLTVNGKKVEITAAEVVLSSKTEIIEMEYYYPQLTSTELLNYQWRMSSTEDWSDWSSTRELTLYNPKPGSYQLEVRARDEHQVLSEQTIPFLIKESWYQNRTIQLLLGILCAGGFYYLIKQKEKKARLKQELESQRAMTMASLESRALRAQMNPHFLFNILNNLQEMILSGETHLAQTYLNKFARLMRMILNISAREYVSIEEEVDFLKLYLDLEQLRFDDHLKISIEIDPELNMAEIPVFMVQPLVENAIRHGLRPKTGEKSLELRIEPDQPYIRIVVKDNGRGLTGKKGMSDSQEGSRVNALHVIEQRLNIISQSSGLDCKITLRESWDGPGVESELLLPYN